MRLHWCALDDPGGALGLKNRLINKRGHLVQSGAATPSCTYLLRHCAACVFLTGVPSRAHR